jgi:hypothetical protein
LHEAAPAGLHADTKSLHVLTTRRAEFAAAACAGSRTVGLRNSRRPSKKHCYDERPTGDSAYHHLGILENLPPDGSIYVGIREDGDNE